MPTDIAVAIRTLGTSDMEAMGIDPHRGPLDDWRAMRERNGCSVLEAITRENKIAARPGVATVRPAEPKPPKPKGRTIESRKATGAIVGATRRAACEMWENVTEVRDGLVTMSRADGIMKRGHGMMRNAVRAGQIGTVDVLCKPLGRVLHMVLLSDIAFMRAGGRMGQ